MRETHVLLEGVWERLVRAVEEGSKRQSKSLKGSKLRRTSTLTFSKTMHDATMSMNTQDEILVHRRLLLPLFPLPSVFSVFIPLSEAWLRKDDRIAINRDFYYSSDSYILTRYLLSRRLLISRKFFSVHCGFSFLPSYHSIHGVVQRILSQKHASSVHIEGDGGLKWFKELPITVRVITCSWLDPVSRVTGIPGWYWILEIKCSDTTGVGLVAPAGFLAPEGQKPEEAP